MTKAVAVTKLAERFLQKNGVHNPAVAALFSDVAKRLEALPRDKAVDGADEVLASITEIMAKQRAATNRDVPRFLSYQGIGAQAGAAEEAAPAAQQSSPRTTLKP